MMTTKPCAYRFVFPEVLRRMDYASKLSPNDISMVEVPDTRDVLTWYISEMIGGVTYEKRLNETWNTCLPHTLTRENFTNARNVSSMGWSYAALPPVLDVAIPQLEAIPPWADLFDSASFDSAVGDLIEVLNGQKGFGIANACKLFYQKRPRLVPILDEFNRRVLNIPWANDDNEDIVTPALHAIRNVADYGSNAETLANLRNWIRLNSSITGGLPLSTLRIIDILAWGVIRQQKDKEKIEGNGESE